MSEGQQRPPAHVKTFEEQFNEVKTNASIIAWLGFFSNFFMFIASICIIFWYKETIKFLIPFWPDQVDLHHTTKQVETYVSVASSSAYLLSLINLLTCTMLLIAIKKRRPGLVVPWLICHGLIFGAGVHLVLYFVIAGFFTEASSFFATVMIFAFGLVFFFKTFHEVYLLFTMLNEARLQMETRLEFQQPSFGMPNSIRLIDDSVFLQYPL